MQEHLKIRLTGAIILVVLVVSLVPEMFRGRPEGRSAHRDSVGEELPLHSYTIDLRSGPVPQSGTGVPATVTPVTPARTQPANGPAAASGPTAEPAAAATAASNRWTLSPARR